MGSLSPCRRTGSTGELPSPPHFPSASSSSWLTLFLPRSFPCLKLPPTPSLAVSPGPRESLLARFVRHVYAPNLVRKPVKFLVLTLFSGLFVLSCIGARHVDLGLGASHLPDLARLVRTPSLTAHEPLLADQRLALPSSSYLVDYFNSIDAYLDVGPPVYFVAEKINTTALSNVRHLCSRFSTCDEFSLANVLEAERKRPESSYLAEPPCVLSPRASLRLGALVVGAVPTLLVLRPQRRLARRLHLVDQPDPRGLLPGQAPQ